MSQGDIFPASPPPPGLLNGVIITDTDPGAVGPGIPWVAPSTGLLKVRNPANTGWEGIAIGTIPSVGLVGDIAAEAIASTAAAGATGRFADAAHRHAMPASGAPVASAPGDTQATGAAGTFADSAHRHAREAFAAPTIALGTAAAAGAATTLIRSDATILAFDVTAPVTQALGDAAATGAAAVTARRDHKHGMPALSVATPLVESGAGATGSGIPSSREDHVHPASAGTALGATLQRVTRTAGNLTMAANTVSMTELSSTLRLTIAAAVGDVLLIGLSAIFRAGGTGEALADSATIVAGVIKHQVSPGTSGSGHGGYSGLPAADINGLGGTLTYVVAADDITAGNVTVSITYVNTDGAATGTFYADAIHGLTYWVMNTKH